jgi:hypothetical protein
MSLCITNPLSFNPVCFLSNPLYDPFPLHPFLPLCKYVELRPHPFRILPSYLFPQRAYKYKEYDSACPLVGIGTPPPPSHASECAPPPGTKGGGGLRSPKDERGWGGGFQFRRLEKKLSTLLLCAPSPYYPDAKRIQDVYITGKLAPLPHIRVH